MENQATTLPEVNKSLPKNTANNFNLTEGINSEVSKTKNQATYDSATGKRLTDFDLYRVTKEKFIPHTPTIITIENAPVAAPGNITPITAEGKAGKTAASSLFLAGSISLDGKIDGFPAVEVLPNPRSKAVIHFDTEQSESDQQYNLIKILQRAGLEKTPDNFLSYNIRTLPMSSYQQMTTQICDLAFQEFNGIHLIVIDGAADFIASVNDESEANAIIAFFINLAVKYMCPVLIIIHLNENASRTKDTMPRGHVGKQAVRKGYCQLNITKEGEISTLKVLRARKASSETPSVSFRYSVEKGYHVSVDSEALQGSIEQDKDAQGRKKAEKIASKIFAPPTALLYKDAIPLLMKNTSKSESTAKRYLREMEGWGIISKSEDGFYRLSDYGVN